MSEAKQTAYDRSLTVAQALMASVQKQKTDLERMEQETAEVKQAFRTAYEYWQEMQPVNLSCDYFTLAGSRADTRFNTAGQGKMVELLLCAVLEWLEWKAVQSAGDLQ